MSKTIYREPYETHGIFINRQTEGNIIELLYRVKPDNNNYILRDDIINKLHLLNENIKEYNIITTTGAKCHIYINYLDSNGVQLGHLSLHIEPENKQISYINRKKGRIHFKNNSKNKYYTVRFDMKESNKNYIINNYSSNTDLNNFMKATLIVLKEYFDDKSSISLKLNRTGHRNNVNKISKPLHPCFNTIKTSLNSTIKTRLKKTPKHLKTQKNKKIY